MKQNPLDSVLDTLLNKMIEILPDLFAILVILIAMAVIVHFIKKRD